MAEPKSFYRQQIEGGAVTLESLRDKIAEIQRRQEELLKQASEGEEGDKADEEVADAEFESEDVRGFTDGGASEEEKDTEEDLVAQLEALQEQEELVKAQQALNEIFDEALKNGELENERDDGKGGGGFKCSSLEEAQKLAESISAQYESLGIKCNIVQDKNSVTVVVHLPEKFKDRNPLSMSASELQEASKESDLEREKGANSKEIPGTSPKPTLGKWTGMVNDKREIDKTSQRGHNEGGYVPNL